MIFCQNNIYGKVWKIMKKTDKYMDVQMTTSEKDQEGNYVNSGWFPRLIGHAFNSLKDDLKEGDRIIIKKAKLTNERYTSKEDGTVKSSFRFLVLEAEVDAAKTEQTTAPAPTTQESVTQAKDECPW